MATLRHQLGLQASFDMEVQLDLRQASIKSLETSIGIFFFTEESARMDCGYIGYQPLWPATGSW